MGIVKYRIASSFLTPLVLLYSCSLSLICCKPVNVTSSNLEPSVASRHSMIADVMLTQGTILGERVTLLDSIVVATENMTGCSLSTVDPFIPSVITQLIADNALIEYRLHFTNYAGNK